MPEEKESDINYQPKTQSFSYSSEKNKPKNKSNIFITLVLGIFGFLLLFFIFLAVLNYFNILSLSSVPPVFTNFTSKFGKALKPNPEQKITNIPGTNVYTLYGTLYGYNLEIIKVKFNNKVLDFKLIFGQSSFYTQSGFKIQPIGTESAGIIQIPGFFSDLEKEENIGKKVSIQYRTENKINILETIILYK